jgi:hypothetical protein
VPPESVTTESPARVTSRLALISEPMSEAAKAGRAATGSVARATSTTTTISDTGLRHDKEPAAAGCRYVT